MESNPNQLARLINKIVNHPKFKVYYWFFAITFSIIVVSYLIFVLTHAEACTCVINQTNGHNLTNYISAAHGGCVNKCVSQGGVVTNLSNAFL